MRAISETIFDIVYLVTVVTIGIRMIRGSKGNRQFQLFGWMAVVLGAGDSFHLVPRALALCTTGFDAYAVQLGLGKWITSITMTVFYVLLYYVWRERYQVKNHVGTTVAIFALAAMRVALCMLPQNQWLTNQTPLTWGILRNIPFAIMGLMVIVLFYRSAKGGQRRGLPLDVAHHRAELWLLHSRGPVGRGRAGYRHAHDPEDLRVCVDRADRLQRHEGGVLGGRCARDTCPTEAYKVPCSDSPAQDEGHI